MSQLSSFDLLFSRLTHPFPLVRERACMSISFLLLNRELKLKTENSLLKWMQAQKLESLVPMGLLALLRAKLTDNSFKMPPSVLLSKSIRKHSLLSDVLLTKCINNVSIGKKNMHSSSAPDNYKVEPFFDKYRQYAILQWYNSRIEEIEKTSRLPVKKQWSFEFSALIRENNLKPSTDPLYDRGRPDDEHYKIFDSLLSEIYVSSYLRTLAWLASNGLPRQELLNLASEICPINLDLWNLQPNPRPSYWPRIDSTVKDSGIQEEIWKQVTKVLQTKPLAKTEWVIAKADGRVFEGKDVFDLTISGCFKLPIGSFELNEEDLVSFLQDCPGTIRYKNDLLSFEGNIKPVNLTEGEVYFGDWILYPATWETGPNNISSWQFWRLSRSINFPAPFLLENIGSFKCRCNVLEINEGNNLIARWLDWTDGLTEKVTANLSLSTGNVLLLKRSVVERFQNKTNSKFFWGCCVRRYSRTNRFQNYDIDNKYRIYETT